MGELIDEMMGQVCDWVQGSSLASEKQLVSFLRQTTNRPIRMISHTRPWVKAYNVCAQQRIFDIHDVEIYNECDYGSEDGQVVF